MFTEYLPPSILVVLYPSSQAQETAKREMNRTVETSRKILMAPPFRKTRCRIHVFRLQRLNHNPRRDPAPPRGEAARVAYEWLVSRCNVVTVSRKEKEMTKAKAKEKASSRKKRCCVCDRMLPTKQFAYWGQSGTQIRLCSSCAKKKLKLGRN